MAITFNLEDYIGSWKQYKKLIHTTLFESKANNQHIDFVNLTADLRDS